MQHEPRRKGQVQTEVGGHLREGCELLHRSSGGMGGRAQDYGTVQGDTALGRGVCGVLSDESCRKHT